MSDRSHCPTLFGVNPSQLGVLRKELPSTDQAPQALAKRVPPAAVRLSKSPSRSTVARISSDPGATKNGHATCKPAESASPAIPFAREKSSYEEFVQDPMRAAEIAAGEPLAFILSANLESGSEMSGEYL